MAAEPARPLASRLPALVAAADRFLSGFSTPRRLLVALSGGADSRALLLALAHCRPRFADLALTAVTVDHRLRPAAAEEAEDAGRFAASLGIAHRVVAWDGPKTLTGLQAAARAARYGLLVAAAEEAGAAAILTAHHADDQAETLVMRAARTGAAGATGMAPAMLASGRIWVCRPFLALRKDDLRAALAEAGHGWSEDPANRDPRFERARLRLSGPPPRLPADRQGEAAALAVAAAAALAGHVRLLGGGVAVVSPALTGETGRARAGGLRALHLLAAVLGARDHPPGAVTAARLAAFLDSAAPGRFTALGCVFDRRRDALHLYREARDLPAQGAETVRAHLLAAGLPQDVARRAAPALAAFGPPAALAPYAGFLPLFELPAAAALARLFALPDLPPCPIQDEIICHT